MKPFIPLSNLWDSHTIHIITDGYDWVIHEVSKSLTDALNRQALANASFGSSFHLMHHKLLHFNAVRVPRRYKTNKVLMTWYHINENDPRLHRLEKTAACIDLLHTTAKTTEATLIAHGFPKEKIRVVPMGIDVSLFTPQTEELRTIARQSLGIPHGTFVIGSFQKDGDGWGEGLNPKRIKGPDVFCDVMEQIAAHYPIHILLSGPSRGYVKERLHRAGIPFTHRYLERYQDVNNLYHALDVYLIASRKEGVPLALLESWATKIPLVSTRVGMVTDVALDRQTALLADIEDRDKLTAAISDIFENRSTAQRMAERALQEVVLYDWNKLINRYWEELYKPLL